MNRLYGNHQQPTTYIFNFDIQICNIQFNSISIVNFNDSKADVILRHPSRFIVKPS